PPRPGRSPLRLHSHHRSLAGAAFGAAAAGAHLLRRVGPRGGGGAARGRPFRRGGAGRAAQADRPGAQGGSLMDALIELSWKCSLVLVLGGFAAICARRASAATRHLIWAAALAGALALPAASMLLPRIRVAALPARAPLSAPVVAHRVWKSVEPISKGADVAAAPGRPALPAPPPLASEPTIDWAGMARLLWATVALALLLRVAAGDLQLRAVARRAQRVIDREWLDLLEGTCARLGLRRDVELLESDETEVPLTWGTLRPRLLLPAGSSSWPDAQKRAVLAHELAHVERHDALTQLIARVACAVHWFNPLAWAAAAALRR